MSIGSNLKRIRTSKDLSLRDLARISMVSKSTIIEIENNIENRNPTQNTLNKLAQALKVSIDEFYKEDPSVQNIAQENEPIEKSMPVIPEKFTVPDEARAYVRSHKIFGSNGFNPAKMTDEEILEFANALLEQMQLVAYKYKK